MLFPGARKQVLQPTKQRATLQNKLEINNVTQMLPPYRVWQL
jgi:hypothetical protein